MGKWWNRHWARSDALNSRHMKLYLNPRYYLSKLIELSMRLMSWLLPDNFYSFVQDSTIDPEIFLHWSYLLKAPGCHIIPSLFVKACADICNICSVYSSFILEEDLHCGSSKKPSIMGKRDRRRMISPLLSCHAQKREEHVRVNFVKYSSAISKWLQCSSSALGLGVWISEHQWIIPASSIQSLNATACQGSLCAPLLLRINEVTCSYHLGNHLFVNIS